MLAVRYYHVVHNVVTIFEASCCKGKIMNGSLVCRTPTAAACGKTAADLLSAYVLSVVNQPDVFSHKKRNRFMHYLDGNWFTTHTWRNAKSHLWRTRVSLYNGMVVFQFKDYQTYFEAFVCRRGWYYVFCSDPSSSPKLYQCLRKAVTSRRGGPGCRRTPADPLLCSTRVCACTSPAFDVDAAAACCSTSPDVFSFQVSSSRRHVPRSWRSTARPGDSSPGHGRRPGPLRRLRRLDRPPAAQPGPGPGRSAAGDDPGSWSSIGRSWSGRPGAGATGRSRRTSLGVASGAGQASRPTRPSPAMGRWTRVERPGAGQRTPGLAVGK